MKLSLRPEPWPTPREILINTWACANVVVEQAFGLLKGRWRCLLDKLDESLDKVPSSIITCCILHNICLEVNDGTEIDVANDEDGFLGVPLPGHDINADGARLRNTIKDTFIDTEALIIWTASFSFHLSLSLNSFKKGLTLKHFQFGLFWCPSIIWNIDLSSQKVNP